MPQTKLVGGVPSALPTAQVKTAPSAEKEEVPAYSGLLAAYDKILFAGSACSEGHPAGQVPAQDTPEVPPVEGFVAAARDVERAATRLVRSLTGARGDAADLLVTVVLLVSNVVRIVQRETEAGRILAPGGGMASTARPARTSAHWPDPAFLRWPRLVYFLSLLALVVVSRTDTAVGIWLRTFSATIVR